MLPYHVLQKEFLAHVIMIYGLINHTTIEKDVSGNSPGVVNVKPYCDTKICNKEILCGNNAAVKQLQLLTGFGF